MHMLATLFRSKLVLCIKSQWNTLNFPLITWLKCEDVPKSFQVLIRLFFLPDNKHSFRGHQGVTSQPGLLCFCQRPVEPSQVNAAAMFRSFNPLLTGFPSWMCWDVCVPGRPSWFCLCPWWTRGSRSCCAAPSSTASSVSFTSTRKVRGRLSQPCCPPPLTVRFLFTSFMGWLVTNYDTSKKQ